MTDEYLMTGLVSLYQVKLELSSLDERAQISVDKLKYFSMIIDYTLCYNLNRYAQRLIIACSKLRAVVELSNVITSDKTAKQTIVEQKDFICDNFFDAWSEILSFAGPYYDTEHSFTPNPSNYRLYNEIINHCIDDGYYFGREES